MAKELEKKLLKELSRFKEIGRNSSNLDEQIIGSGSGFDEQQGESDLLMKFKKRQDVGEQEDDLDIPLDPEAETEDETEELDVAVEDEIETEDVLDTDIDSELDTELDTGLDSDTKELDVTDLVTKQDEVNTELSDQKDILSKNSESLDDLMDKLSELETHLTSMDDMVQKIGNLENKIEEYRPRTPEEKISLRKHDSGPYTQNLSDYFIDKEEVFDKTGKKQYILTKDDVDNYSKDDIKKSFTQPEDEEE
jgi:hypothetical protein|tara:strand:+ start:3803 stop:4555 length:753 start_codon:yes stop_codon:yes gene_type:complete